MNFTTFEYFQALTQAPSIRAAAERLMISQQALSAQIQRLEQELGVKLLTRSRPAVLTPCGERFAEYASEMILLRRQLERDLAELSGQVRELLISVPNTGCPPFLMDAIAAFTELEPGWLVRLEERPENLSATDLRKYDLSISQRHIHGEMEYIQLQVRDMRPHQHPAEDQIRSNYFSVLVHKSLLQRLWGGEYAARLAQLLDTKDLSLLQDIPFIRAEGSIDTIDRYLREQSFSPDVVASVSNIDTCFNLCAAGVGAMFAPDGWNLQKLRSLNSQDSMVLLRLDQFFPSMDCFICYEKDKVLSPQEQRFIQCLCSASQAADASSKQPGEHAGGFRQNK